jgi:hypothetical protein
MFVFQDDNIVMSAFVTVLNAITHEKSFHV